MGEALPSSTGSAMSLPEPPVPLATTSAALGCWSTSRDVGRGDTWLPTCSKGHHVEPGLNLGRALPGMSLGTTSDGDGAGPWGGQGARGQLSVACGLVWVPLSLLGGDSWVGQRGAGSRGAEPLTPASGWAWGGCAGEEPCQAAAGWVGGRREAWCRTRWWPDLGTGCCTPLWGGFGWVMAMAWGHRDCAGATSLPGEGGLPAGGSVWDESLVTGVTELPLLWPCCGRLPALPRLSPCPALRVLCRVTSKWPDGTGRTRHIPLRSSIQLGEGLRGDWGTCGDGGLPLLGWGSPRVPLSRGGRDLGTMVFLRGDGRNGSPATPMFLGSDGVLLAEQRTSAVRCHQGCHDGTVTLAGCLPHPFTGVMWDRQSDEGATPGWERGD